MTMTRGVRLSGGFRVFGQVEPHRPCGYVAGRVEILDGETVVRTIDYRVYGPFDGRLISLTRGKDVRVQIFEKFRKHCLLGEIVSDVRQVDPEADSVSGPQREGTAGQRAAIYPTGN